MTALLDIDSGRVVASRRQLDVLVAWARGRGEPDDETVSELRAAGFIVDGTVHPSLNPVVAVLGGVTGRAAVRRWSGGRRPIVEVLVGGAGVLVLPGGHELDAAQELRWHHRSAALARVLAGLLRVPAGESPAVIGPGRRSWTGLVDAASGTEGLTLVDLRWATRPGAPLASVMVLAWAEDGGVVEAVPVSGEPDAVTCRPRHPLEVWTGLTTLVGSAHGEVLGAG